MPLTPVPPADTPGPAWGGERRQRLAIGVLALALAVTYVVGVQLTTRPGESFLQGDAKSYFVYLPSLVVDRDLDLRNQFAVLQPEGEAEYPFGRTRDGRARNPFPIAPAIMWLPGYVAGVGVEAATGSPNAPLGYGRIAVLATAIWSILLVGFAAEMTRRVLIELVDPEAALPATLMAWLGTPALYYSLITPLYSHAPAWMTVGAMVWLSWRASTRGPSPVWWMLAGVAGGWMVAVRLQDVPLLVVPPALLAVSVARDRSRSIQSGVALALGIAAGYFVQGALWYRFEGVLIPFGDEPMAVPTLSNLAGVLFSTGYRGWISWTPIVLPGLIGLAVLVRYSHMPMARALGVASLIGVAGLVMIDVTHPFGAGASYGGRRYVSLTPFIAMGLAVLVSRAPSSRRRVLWGVLAALTAWNLWLLFAYEMLVVRHGVYPTLLQAVRYAVGLGVP